MREWCNLGVLRVEVQVHSALGHVSLQGRCLDHNLGWLVKFEVPEAGQLPTWFSRLVSDDESRSVDLIPLESMFFQSCSLYQSDMTIENPE